jgi:hypothetical protein
VAGRQLNLQLKTKALLIAILLPIMSSLSVVVTHITMVHFKFEQVSLLLRPFVNVSQKISFKGDTIHIFGHSNLYDGCILVSGL